MNSNIKLFNNLIKYDFNLNREGKTVSECLDIHFKKYINDLKECIELNNGFIDKEFNHKLSGKIEFIENICTRIVEVSKDYRNGKIKDSFVKSEKVFEDISQYFFTHYNSYIDNRYYRIRKGNFAINDNEDSKKKKANLFHIKDIDRRFINSYRYSILGFPCLYLAEGFELACFECGMPSEFSYCQMRLESNKFKIIDFSERPHELRVYIVNALSNANSEEDKERAYTILLNYIITYPIAIACSLKVENRGDVFVEEYVLPQMLMQWIKNSNDYDGVRYKSSLKTTLVDGFGANNIVLAVKKFREDGLDEKLTNSIEVSDIGYFDVRNYFIKFKDYLSELENYKLKISKSSDIIIGSVLHREYRSDIITLCNGINVIYTSLIKGNYINIDLIYHQINCLWYYIERIKKSKEDICKKISTTINTNSELYRGVDKDNILNIIQSDIDEFANITLKIVNLNVVFHFDNEELDDFEKI